jgi:branched-chain amino acid transport system ATP-binding protein
VGVSAGSETVLEVRDVHVGYGDLEVVHGLSVSLVSGRITLLLGRNGAGKTTLAKAIAGLLRVSSGEVVLDGVRIDRMPTHKRAARGLAVVQEGKHIFRRLTVEQNLNVCINSLPTAQRRMRKQLLADAYSRFPALASRGGTVAASLSGGQQQMLAVAQALVRQAHVFVFDEPTAGLSPAIAQEVIQSIAQLRAQDTAILLIEQALHRVFPVVDDVLLIDNGVVRFHADRQDISNVSEIETVYLGL